MHSLDLLWGRPSSPSRSDSRSTGALEWQRLETLSNYRLTDLSTEDTMSDPDGPLSAYDNAFFRRGWEANDGSLVPPEMVYGQGTVGDFADADVIIRSRALRGLDQEALGTPTEHGSSAEPARSTKGSPTTSPPSSPTIPRSAHTAESPSVAPTFAPDGMPAAQTP